MFRKLFGQLPWVKEAQQDVDSTPDMHELEEATHRRLFIYDDMMKGLKNFTMLYETGSEPMGYAYTTNRFQTWVRSPSEVFALPFDENSCPVTWIGRNNPPPAKIRGEVLNVPSHYFKELDKFYDNMLRFNRTRVRLIVPYFKGSHTQQGFMVSKKERYFSLEAWMYVGEPRFWERRIDLGYEFKPVQTFNTLMNNKPSTFSQFTLDQIVKPTKTFYDPVDNNALYEEYLKELKDAEQSRNSA